MLNGNYIIQIGLMNDKDTILFGRREMPYELLCEYEKETGYKCEDLLEDGIDEFQLYEIIKYNYNEYGEKNDKKEVTRDALRRITYKHKREKQSKEEQIEQAIKDKTESNKGKITMKSLIQEVLGVDQIRSGEVENVDKIEPKESIKEEIKEGVSIDD